MQGAFSGIRTHKLRKKFAYDAYTLPLDLVLAQVVEGWDSVRAGRVRVRGRTWAFFSSE